jgi:hypothetical protein
MRINIVGATVILSLCGIPLQAAASVCVKPWAIPDKWIDNHDETEPIDQIWTLDDTFETVGADGNPLPDADADVYRQTSSSAGPGTGFSSSDVGQRVWLKVKDAGIAIQGGFFAVDIGGAGGGADAYRTAIATWMCDPAAPDFVHMGDVLPVLKGDLHGPTIQGVLDLISQDPNAYWDDAARTVAGSCANEATPCGPYSPRLAAVAAFDPAEFEFEQLNNAPGPLRVRVSNIVGVFVEGYFNGYVLGRLALIPGQ